MYLKHLQDEMFLLQKEPVKNAVLKTCIVGCWMKRYFKALGKFNRQEKVEGDERTNFRFENKKYDVVRYEKINVHNNLSCILDLIEKKENPIFPVSVFETF